MTRRFVLAAIVCACARAAHAQSGGGYDLSWNTIDGGGGSGPTGGALTLSCTIGQPDAGFFTGGAFTLGGGFWKGGGNVTAVGDEPIAQSTPRVFALYAPAPNPLHEATTVRFDLPRASHVRVRVYDTRGALVHELVNDAMAPGRYVRTWNARDAASGVYFLRADTETERAERRIVVMR